MGFIIPYIEIPNTGVGFSNAYAAIAGNPIHIVKQPPQHNTQEPFYIDYTFNIWANLEARKENKQPILQDTHNIVFDLTTVYQGANIFYAVYQHMKYLHPEYIDHVDDESNTQ